MSGNASPAPTGSTANAKEQAVRYITINLIPAGEDKFVVTTDDNTGLPVEVMAGILRQVADKFEDGAYSPEGEGYAH